MSQKHTEKIQLVLFDLLTALLDSWTVWNEAANSPQMGHLWRMNYLKLTYGCGAYQPYEALVAQAAKNVGLDTQAVDRLQASWKDLSPWSEAPAVLKQLQHNYRLGVVTNCSRQLGEIAAQCVGGPFDVIVTSADAGFYKPDPRPYHMALETAKVSPQQAVFVAGSAYDLFGTAKVGLRTFWHNRIGLEKPVNAPSPVATFSDLGSLPEAIEKLQEQ